MKTWTPRSGTWPWNEHNWQPARPGCVRLKSSLLTHKSPLRSAVLSPKSPPVKGKRLRRTFSAPTFVTILDLDRLEVLAYVDETDIGRVEPGQIATFTVDTYPDKEFKAIVNAIQPRAELQDSVVNYIVRLDFEADDDYVLRPEMTAHVRLVVAEREDALTAPRNALKRRDGRQFVVVERAGEWIETDVRTGWRSEGAIEILSGVSDGDVVELNPSVVSYIK